MLLSKLKVFWAVALMVAVSTAAGLTYRAAAQAPNQVQAEPVANAAQLAVRHAPDDLEALRLEIEALRKEVRAVRERMKGLEAQVGALQVRGQIPVGASVPAGVRPGEPVVNANSYYSVSIILRNADPLAEAEAALKRLRQDPNDKQATESLEQALKQLKEQGKPKK